MDAERWRRVERLLDAVLRREQPEWEHVLDERCAGDAGLRREVGVLLSRVTAARHFLDERPAKAAAAALAAVQDLESAAMCPGRRIGAYRIVREIGRGGTARVFLAARDDDGLAPTVALKLLHAGLDTETGRDRFLDERRILARLSHRNIARPLDGGVTEDGLSYLVLEHVDGEPLDRYCDARDATIEHRLALFTEVAEATQYAHDHLVVHRDLKPSNILVTSDDGTVKLLDFGLAKLLEPDAAPETPATRAGYRWMTPEYAAPEQVVGGPVTTHTDVYQLGVVLFELLSGRLPFAHRSGSSRELEAAVLREDPPLPSSFRPALRGDLDAIVLRAIRKEPDRRYPSVSALIEDIRRHRERRPALARRSAAAYRIRGPATGRPPSACSARAPARCATDSARRRR